MQERDRDSKRVECEGEYYVCAKVCAQVRTAPAEPVKKPAGALRQVVWPADDW
jgi:hypothetical protein